MYHKSHSTVSREKQGKAANNGGEVQLCPVYSNDANHENKAFWEATPSGLLTMSIKSDAIAQFELGQEYYLDFTPALQTVQE
jgi:hypothetical protein